MLQASRPEELPSPWSETVPVTDKVTGKGRGGSADAMGSGGPGMGQSGYYETPPSVKGTVTGGRWGDRAAGRTQGLMPEEDHDVKRVKTMGTMPRATMKQHEKNGDDDDGLQRELEKAVVNELREENERMAAEIQQLREQQRQQRRVPQPGDTSSSSWSMIGEVRRERSRERSRGHRGRPSCRTPRRETTKDKVRFTPNGTQVPLGTPPPEAPLSLQPLPPLPPVPGCEATTQRAIDFGVYEKVDDDGRDGRMGSRQWQPSGVVQPNEARAMWLERELQSLRDAMVNQPVNSAVRKSEYWSQAFRPVPFNDARASMLGAPGDRECDRASASARDDRDGGHSLTVARDRVYGSDRASMEHHGHEPGHLRYAGGVRDPGEDRAWHGMRDGECDGHLRGITTQLRHGIDRREGGNDRERWEDSAQSLRDGLREINERAEYERLKKQYMQAEGGYGYGDPQLPANDVRSATWIPPPGGGKDGGCDWPKW